MLNCAIWVNEEPQAKLQKWGNFFFLKKLQELIDLKNIIDMNKSCFKYDFI